MQIMLISDLRGEIGKLESLIKKCADYSLDALCFCGNIVKGRARYLEWLDSRREGKIPNRNQVEILEEALEDLRDYKQFCALVDSLGVPVMLIPGQLDAPEERYFLFMQQAAFTSDNLILLHENISKVGSFIFTGFGGQLSPNDKEDYFVLNYPQRECVFGTRRMHFLNPPRILLFHTPPIGRLDMQNGEHIGSRFVNDLILSVMPSMLFCGSATQSPGVEEIGSTVVINPGALAEGRYALVNTKDCSAKLLNL